MRPSRPVGGNTEVEGAPPTKDLTVATTVSAQAEGEGEGVTVRIATFPVDEVHSFPGRLTGDPNEPDTGVSLVCTEALVFEDGFEFDALVQTNNALMVRSIQDRRWGARPGATPEELVRVEIFDERLNRVGVTTLGEAEEQRARLLEFGGSARSVELFDKSRLLGLDVSKVTALESLSTGVVVVGGFLHGEQLRRQVGRKNGLPLGWVPTVVPKARSFVALLREDGGREWVFEIDYPEIEVVAAKRMAFGGLAVLLRGLKNSMHPWADARLRETRWHRVSRGVDTLIVLVLGENGQELALTGALSVGVDDRDRRASLAVIGDAIYVGAATPGGARLGNVPFQDAKLNRLARGALMRFELTKKSEDDKR